MMWIILGSATHQTDTLSKTTFVIAKTNNYNKKEG